MKIDTSKIVTRSHASVLLHETANKINRESKKKEKVEVVFDQSIKTNRYNSYFYLELRVEVDNKPLWNIAKLIEPSDLMIGDIWEEFISKDIEDMYKDMLAMMITDTVHNCRLVVEPEKE